MDLRFMCVVRFFAAPHLSTLSGPTHHAGR
jgi:hypothetical protein